MAASEARERYQPETKIEAGLGGERWVAVDTETNKAVLLSVLDARMATEDQRAAFELWAKKGRTLNHPSLERVLASGETALGNPYFATEIFETETLAQRLVREPAMSLHELVRVMTGIVDGLVVAHKMGLPHGDISPDRIHMIASGRARLTAFGLNRALARTEARGREASFLAAGDAYMSPEQAEGELDAASADLWSIAAILYRGFTGVPPRTLEDGQSTAASILAGPTIPVTELRADAPASFAQLLDRALADDRATRFQDIGELRKALTSALILAPIVARMPVALPPDVETRISQIDTSAPALPPPPNRPRTAIGPFGARASLRPAVKQWASAPPPNVPRGTPNANTREATLGKVALVRTTVSVGPVNATEIQAPRHLSRPLPPPIPRTHAPRPPFGNPAWVPARGGRSVPPPSVEGATALARSREETPTDPAPAPIASASVDNDDEVVTSYDAKAVARLSLPEPEILEELEAAELVEDEGELLDDEGELVEELDEANLVDTDEAPAIAAPPPAIAAPPPAIAAPPPAIASSAAPSARAIPPTTPVESASARAQAAIPAVASSAASAPSAPVTASSAVSVVRADEPMRLPPKAWAAIAVFALGCFVAVMGGLELAGSRRERAPATSRAPTTYPPTPVAASALDAGGSTPTAADAGTIALDAGFDAGLAVTNEPTPPEIVTPVAEPSPRAPRAPRVTPPRTSGVTVQTSAMTTTTPTTTSPAPPPPRMTESMTTSTHTLERDPGF